MSKRRETWDGGYIHTTKAGKRVYVIRKRVDGTLYEVSTRCTSSRAAEEQWRRFQANPGGYEPTGGLPGDPLILDVKLIAAFLAWSRDERRNSPEWVGEQSRELAWWLEKLKGKDLRRASLEEDILPPLEGVGGRPHKIEVLKTLYSWLVTVRRSLKPAEDPTFRALKVPQARPEQWRRPKAFGQDDYRRIRAALAGEPQKRAQRACSFVDCGHEILARGLCAAHYQQQRKGKPLVSLRAAGAGWVDLIDLLAATGWHVRELERFARGGQIVRIVGRGPILESPYAKAGNPLRTEVSDEVALIAERVLVRGPFSRSHLDRAIRAAAKATGVSVTPGTFRHAIATWAINAGAAPAAVSAFLNHKSERTTKRFYATFAVAAKVPTLK